MMNILLCWTGPMILVSDEEKVAKVAFLINSN